MTAALRALAAEGWTSLDDVRLPGHAGTGVDHVVVGPGGVVVVDVRTQTPGAADVTRAAWSAATVTSLLAPRHRSAVRAVVCLAPGAPADATASDGPVVLAHDALAAHLRSLPPRLHPADVSGLAQHLGLHLDGSHLPDLLTTGELDARPRAARRRAVRPLTVAAPPVHPPDVHRPAAHADDVDLDLTRRGPLALAVRAVVVVSVTWLAWVFTTAPLGLI